MTLPSLGEQIALLFLLAIPIACVAWTVTHEELFRELHDYCARRSEAGGSLLVRKFFYLFTCEYCFSHYVTIGFLILTGFRLVLDDWRGYVLAGFALVWIANQYMSLYARFRIDLKRERLEVKQVEAKVEQETGEPPH
jgi:hypothetical protein